MASPPLARVVPLPLQVEETADVTVGGVVLPETAKERPVSGVVVSVGPGKYDAEAEGKRRPMVVGARMQAAGPRRARVLVNREGFVGTAVLQVQPGDRVLYFKYAGDSMETPSGEKYVVLREDDILCKA